MKTPGDSEFATAGGDMCHSIACGTNRVLPQVSSPSVSKQPGSEENGVLLPPGPDQGVVRVVWLFCSRGWQSGHLIVG